MKLRATVGEEKILDFELAENGEKTVLKLEATVSPKLGELIGEVLTMLAMNMAQAGPLTSEDPDGYTSTAARQAREDLVTALTGGNLASSI